jgi:hypothetical protein
MFKASLENMNSVSQKIKKEEEEDKEEEGRSKKGREMRRRRKRRQRRREREGEERETHFYQILMFKYTSFFKHCLMTGSTHKPCLMNTKVKWLSTEKS